MKVLNLYTTSGCHLCEIAEALIAPWLVKYDLTLSLIEISASDGLIEAYGVRIPVLRFAEGALELGWPFSEQQFIEFVEMSR